MSKTAQKQKYYVVWKGRRTGIFNSWEECAAQVHGFTGARYKSFNSLAEAEQAYASGPGRMLSQVEAAPKRLGAAHAPILESVSVDAACSGSPGPVEYRGVSTRSREEIFHEGPHAHGTNNVGEFLAIVQALKWLKRKKLSEPVYSDSETAIKWVRRKVCNTTLKPDEQNARLFKLIAQAEAWLRKNKVENPVLKWDTQAWGEIPADFNRK
jgi:ribonuclease HI